MFTYYTTRTNGAAYPTLTVVPAGAKEPGGAWDQVWEIGREDAVQRFGAVAVEAQEVKCAGAVLIGVDTCAETPHKHRHRGTEPRTNTGDTMTTPALTSPTYEQIAHAALPAAIIRKCNDAQTHALGLVLSALDEISDSLSGWCRSAEVFWNDTPPGPVLEVWPFDSAPNDTRTMLLMFDEGGDVRYAENGADWDSTCWFRPTHYDVSEKLKEAWDIM